jgi:hypothetical protein
MLIIIIFGSITNIINYFTHRIIQNIDYQSYIIQASVIISILSIIKLKLFKLPNTKYIYRLFSFALVLYLILKNRLDMSPDLLTHITYIKDIEKNLSNELTNYNSLNFYPNAIHIGLAFISLILELNTFNLVCLSVSLLTATIITSLAEESLEPKISKFVLFLTFSAMLPMLIYLLNRGFLTFIIGILFSLRISMFKLNLKSYFIFVVLIIFIHPSGILLLISKFIYQYKSIFQFKITIFRNFMGYRIFIYSIFVILFAYTVIKLILFPAFSTNISSLDIKSRPVVLDLTTLHNLIKSVYVIGGLEYTLYLILMYTGVLFLLRRSYIKNLVLITYALSVLYVISPFFLSYNNTLNLLIYMFTGFTNSEPDRGLFTQIILIFQIIYFNRNRISLSTVRSKFMIS